MSVSLNKLTYQYSAYLRHFKIFLIHSYIFHLTSSDVISFLVPVSCQETVIAIAIAGPGLQTFWTYH